jgi:hypothetical protein
MCLYFPELKIMTSVLAMWLVVAWYCLQPATPVSSHLKWKPSNWYKAIITQVSITQLLTLVRWQLKDRAIAQAVSRWLPIAGAQVGARFWGMWISWWRKWLWGRFSPSTSVSPANLHSTNCSTITTIYYLGLVRVQWARSGRSTKWTESHPTKNNNNIGTLLPTLLPRDYRLYSHSCLVRVLQNLNKMNA